VLCSALVVSLLLTSPALEARQAKPSEYQVEATYLYNFGRFIQWPNRREVPTNSFLICILGQDPFGPALKETIANEFIDGKSVVAKQVLTTEEAAGCHVLFISASEERRLTQILASLSNSSVLTVSDLPRFTDRGGMIQFVLDDSRVRFEVNVETATRAGLTMSSELLKLATNIRKNYVAGN
jgi:hypothetical protein